MTATLIPTAPPVDPTWRVAAASFLPSGARERATRGWLRHLPLWLLLAVQVALTLRLTNTIYEDEAIYVDAGHDILSHWLTGSALSDDYGTYFSGVPEVYPVLSALLDDVGGLWAVRAFSLLCMVLATLCVRSIGRQLWGARAGGFAAVAFVLTGPVMFLGRFATFDAVTVATLAAGLYLLVVRRGWAAAAFSGVVLALAPLLKYTGAVFIPVVLVVALLTAERRRLRVLLSAVVTAALLGLAWLAVGSSVIGGIEFTTSSREAIVWMATSSLLRYVLLDIGLLLVLALAGVAVSARSVRTTLLALTLLGGGLLLPVAQLRLHEEVSFEKHLGYGAIFLALLAGRALLAVSRRSMGMVLVSLTVVVVAISGLAASHRMFQWTDVSQVVPVLDQLDASGTYLSTSGTQIAYYSDSEGLDLTWEEHYALYDSGTEAMQAAVDDDTYAGFVLNDGEAADGDEAAGTAELLSMIAASDDYELVAEVPVGDGSTAVWLVFQLVQG